MMAHNLEYKYRSTHSAIYLHDCHWNFLVHESEQQMNWYVYSSGLDTDNPPKLTTEQVVALIKGKKIGKNAQVMRSDDPTKNWIKITDTEFSKTFASLKKMESQQKSTEKTQRQAEKSAAQAQRQAEKSAVQAQRQEQKFEVLTQKQEGVTNKYKNLSGYLDYATASVIALYWVSFVVIVCTFGAGIAYGIVNIVREGIKPEFFAASFLSVLLMVAAIMLARLLRMWQLALIEFIRVIMDIEVNTRRP